MEENYKMIPLESSKLPVKQQKRDKKKGKGIAPRADKSQVVPLSQREFLDLENYQNELV